MKAHRFMRYLFLFFFLLNGLILPHNVESKPVSTKKKKTLKKKKHEKKIKKQDDESASTEDSPVIVCKGATPIILLAKQAILIDARTKRVLLEKNADQKMTPSSMSKMMTSYLIEEKIKQGKLTLETSFPVSEKAWRMGGSKTFVPLNGTVSVQDLLRGIIIQSGNDACIVAAEGICGSEELFVKEMNDLGQKMGLSQTHFMNASGWPEEGHYSTARDLAMLGLHIVQDHPAFYALYQEKDFTFGTDQKGRPIKQGNRNPLLYTPDLGCDGIKTGHTDDGGYGIVASFVENGQRYILVINGLKTMQKRAEEAKKILLWAKQNFINKKIYTKGDVVEKDAPVWLGVKETVSLVAADDVNLLLPRAEQEKVTMETKFTSPLPAPIKKGDVLGKVLITASTMIHEVPLIAVENVEKVGFMTRLFRSILYLLWGKS